MNVLFAVVDRKPSGVFDACKDGPSWHEPLPTHARVAPGLHVHSACSWVCAMRMGPIAGDAYDSVTAWFLMRLSECNGVQKPAGHGVGIPQSFVLFRWRVTHAHTLQYPYLTFTTSVKDDTL